MRTRAASFVTALATLLLGACGDKQDAPPATAPAASQATGAKQTAEQVQPVAEPSAAVASGAAAGEGLELPEDYQALLKPRFDDLAGLAKSRFVRVLVVHSKLFYFVDAGRQQGITYEALQAFEQHLNQKLKSKTLKVHVVPIPVARDQLLAALASGRAVYLVQFVL